MSDKTESAEQPESMMCDCAAENMPFGRCCKAPAMKQTGDWESARVGDYNRGWNDCIAALTRNAAPHPAPSEPVTAGALLDDYGSTELGYSVVGMPLTDGDKRLMRLITESLGNDHPAFDDLAALIATARSRPGPVAAPAVAQPLTPLTDAQWQVIADTLDCFITRDQKDEIELALGIGTTGAGE